MSTTKENIKSSALKLFNKNGFVNVRLQHIADEAFVSVGNLAYHYPNKESIVLALYKSLTKSQKELLAEYRIVPLFDNIDRLIQQTFMLQAQYIFFYLDTLEIIRAYPTIAEAHQSHIESQINQLTSTLEFNSSRGALKPQSSVGLFRRLSVQIWMTMDLWTTRQAILSRSINDEQNYKDSIWNLLIPHFTDMGKQEYAQMLEKPYDLYF